MKETGILRRIDELGRIVIPKEVRKKLKIREGDLLDIYISENNIVLQKYSAMKDIEVVIKVMLSSFSKSYQLNIIVTDTSQIIGSSKASILNGTRIHNELLNIIAGKEQISINSTSAISITDNYKSEGYTIIKPIVIYGDLNGCLIASSEIEFSKEKKEMLDFLINFISSYILS